MDFTLYSSRQQEYYRLLTKRRLPSFTGNFFQAPQPAVDLLQAVIKRSVESHDRWCLDEVLPSIRSQMISMSTKAMRAFLNVIKDAFLGNSALGIRPILNGAGYLCPFTTSPLEKVTTQDTVRAIKIFSYIGEILVHEQVLIENAPSMEAHVLFLMLVATQKVTHTWPVFLDAVRKGDKDACRAFNALLDFWAAKRTAPRFITNVNLKREYSFRELLDLFGQMEAIKKVQTTESGATEAVTSESIAVTSGASDAPIIFTDLGEARIFVPEDMVGFCNHYSRSIGKKHEMSTQPWLRLVTDFRRHVDEHQHEAEWMWEETRNSNHCLRAHGHDIVGINIKAMRDHGYRKIQLFPDGIFPQAKVRFWLELPLTKQMTYQDHDLNSPELAPTKPDENIYTCVQAFVHYLAIKAQWLLLVAPHHHERFWQTNGNGAAHTTTRIVQPVRPRWMKLRSETWKPSQYAIERAMRVRGQLPPAGKTFYMHRDGHDQAYVVETHPDLSKALCFLTDSMLPSIHAAAS